MTPDDLIERATATIGEGSTRFQMGKKFAGLAVFDLADARAVVEAGIEHGYRLTTGKLIEARKLLEANNAAQDSAIKARCGLAQELLREFGDDSESYGEVGERIETKLREIVEGEA